jgi:DNA helicase-2/ATP-dependent DNA helicase PcrA
MFAPSVLDPARGPTLDPAPDPTARGLTPAQQAAVAHDGGHLLVVAGAGTGKTTTLAARVARIVADGTPPERILLLTFSRRAAAELLRRAGQLCGADVAGRAWGGTFHAVANRLLRLHGRALGLDPSFTVLDQADAADLLALCRAELDAHDRPGARPATRAARKDTMAAILSRCVNTSTSLTEVLDRHFPWCRPERDALRSTFEAYTARKRAAQVLDYDDLLLCWGALLRIPDVAPRLAARFDHVLVDEFQDTNALQADLCEGMTGTGARLTAVGDDAQAIYSFRAATVRNILDFPARFGADVVVLEDNHRSTPEVLAAANAVLAEAPAAERHEKVLRTTRPSGPRPALVSCADEAHQSAEVCARILERLERGTRLLDQCVLVRTGHHSALLELELAARRIPYAKYGGLRFLEAAHVKDLVAALRVVENQRDELAWFRILGLVDGVGPATARRQAAAATAGTLPTVAPDLVAALGDARALAGAGGDDHRPGAAVERVRVWLDPILDRRYGNATARFGDLDALQQAAAGAPSLSRFLAELTLDPPAATGDLAGPPHLDDDYLTISTIHSAKGGEWSVVHVLSLVDGDLPSDLATGDAAQVAEERRLLYVALTRAKDELHCYAPLRMHHHRRSGGVRGDAHGYAPLSRFLTPAVLATMSREGVAADPMPDDGSPDADAGPAGGRGLAEVDSLIGSLLA